jgi:hypothetical protein
VSRRKKAVGALPLFTSTPHSPWIVKRPMIGTRTLHAFQGDFMRFTKLRPRLSKLTPLGLVQALALWQDGLQVCRYCAARPRVDANVA